MQNHERPKPGDHKEIAQGSGPAAILMFLHIAASGYLAYITWYLLRYNSSVFWNLLPFSAALYFYFPAAFALSTQMATDPLTRTVGRVAGVMGMIASLIYAAGLIQQGGNGELQGAGKWLVTASAIAAGAAAALLGRVLFALGIRGGAGYLPKNTQGSKQP